MATSWTALPYPLEDILSKYVHYLKRISSPNKGLKIHERPRFYFMNVYLADKVLSLS